MIIVDTFIGAGIGYVTNWAAIKMLFKPVNPWLFGIQGILVRRKKEFAASLSELVVNRFLMSGLKDILPANQIYSAIDKISAELTVSLLEEAHLPSFKPATRNILKGLIATEIQNMIKDDVPENQKSIESLKDTLQLNIESVPDEEIENLINEISRKEYRAIAIYGAILGGIMIHAGKIINWLY